MLDRSLPWLLSIFRDSFALHQKLLRGPTCLALLTCLMLVSIGHLASAQDDQPATLPRVAYTEPPTEDIDFNMLGEFVGSVQVGEGQFETMGLQLRPLGGGSFDGLHYRGGLPGQAGYAAETLKLIGIRAGDALILSGGPWAIFVQQDQCTLVASDGTRLGQLARLNRGSPTMGAKPPEGAIVLFDGTSTDQFIKAAMTPEGWLMAGADLKPMLQDFDMHIEFRLPYMPNSTGQQRGNSGCYLQSRYEVQVLDSFAELPTFNGCSSLYRTKSADLNMCYPPLAWQTYDIRFTAPRWAADGSKVRNARITVWQNGVLTQNDVELENKTGAGMAENPTLTPTKFQDHSDPVVFRNIWAIDRGLTGGIPFPVMADPAAATVPEQTVASESAPEPETAETETTETPVEALAEPDEDIGEQVDSGPTP